MRVNLNTSPLQTGHSGRGIGTYTRQLQHALQLVSEVELVANATTADVIHYPFFDLFFRTLPLHMPWKKQAVVVTIHDVIPLQFPEHYRPGVRGSLRFLSQQAALRFVDHIITDSVASQQAISKYLGRSQRDITVVPLAAASDFEPQSKIMRQHVREKYGLPKQYILYVGDINYNKNIPQLIQALSGVDEKITLVCVGKNFEKQNIPEWHAIQSVLDEHALHDRVRFVTRIDSDSTDELAAVYQSAACYVQPSLAEGFGLPVLEALQSGTVVVSTQGGSLPEVGGTAALYTDGFSASAMAKTINQALALNKKERIDRIAAGKKWAHTFSWQNTAVATYHVYENAVFNTTN